MLISFSVFYFHFIIITQFRLSIVPTFRVSPGSIQWISICLLQLLQLHLKGRLQKCDPDEAIQNKNKKDSSAFRRLRPILEKLREHQRWVFPKEVPGPKTTPVNQPTRGRRFGKVLDWNKMRNWCISVKFSFKPTFMPLMNNFIAIENRRIRQLLFF